LNRIEKKNESQDNLLATKEALNAEISRAGNKENEIAKNLNDEITRARSAENEISSDINNEVNRATTAEMTINNNLSLLISELTTRLNALADSDDTTLDQLSEIVAYIKNNKTLIDGITTSKVSVSDIIDNLTSTATNKPLSANQGKILKESINSLTKSDIGLGNVENKSSATIRSELTKENVTTALGYTPSSSVSITNNLLATVPGTALDAVQGKALKDQLDKQNSNLSELSGSLVNAMMPNYGAGYSVSNGFVAPVGGWIVCHISSYGAASYISINGRRVSYIGQTITSTSVVDIEGIAPIAKGQAVSIVGHIASIVFYPCIGS